MKNVTVHTEVELWSNWKFRYSHVSCILCNRSSRSIKLGIGHRVEFSSRIPGVESNLPRENNSIIYRGEDRSTFATFRNVSTFPPRLLTRQLESLSLSLWSIEFPTRGQRLEGSIREKRKLLATFNSQSRLLNFYKLTWMGALGVDGYTASFCECDRVSVKTQVVRRPNRHHP